MIGNGSSGIQIVPQLQKLPGTDVTNFIRGPTWVYYRVPPSKHLGRETDDPNPAYTEEEKKKWREDPEALKQYRKGMIHRTNKAFSMVGCQHGLGLLDRIANVLVTVSEKLERGTGCDGFCR